jgi:drug/metabolite transporter (DMT)-like permease
VCAGTLLVTLSDESSSSSTSSVRGSSLAAAVAGSNATAPAAAAVPGSSGSSSGPSHSVWGDLLCLVSAAFYACYTIVLRKALPDDDEANVALFFGYVGLLCSVVFAPVVAVLAGVGALHLKTIPSKAYLIILVQGGHEGVILDVGCRSCCRQWAGG